MNSRPIEIIGGGLAGLSLGLALRRGGAAVTLHEAGHYPRHRVCGEFIAGLDDSTRSILGLDPFLADAARHREVAWFRGGRLLRRQNLPAPALALSRHVLDQRLAQAFVAAGGELHTGSRISPSAKYPGRVWAQGRRSVKDSSWLGLKCHARGPGLATELELHLGSRAYVGLCAIEDGWVNVSGLFRRRPGLSVDRASALTAYLRASGLDALVDRLAAPGVEIDPESHCAVAGLHFGRARDPYSEKNDTVGRLDIGDAHALIPPFTGNGMAMAFQAAALSLDPLLAWSRGDTPWIETCAAVRTRLRARFVRRLTAAGLLHDTLVNPFLQPVLAACARARLLPFTPLYHVLH